MTLGITNPVLLKKTKKWICGDVEDGVITYALSSWKHFPDFIHSEMIRYRSYVWRGQSNSTWVLEPSLDRELKKFKKSIQQRKHAAHLEWFKYAARGRRGSNPPNLVKDNDWWALGQHHGLFTPLLDWTTSPFVAAFFAFAELREDQTPERSVFALSRIGVEEKTKELLRGHNGSDRAPIVEFIRPFSDENSRLVSQAGLFTRAPDYVDMEAWIRKHFQGEQQTMHLIKVTVPNKDRELAMRSLNRMNINHLTLFPDLHGASYFCNTDLVISTY